MIKPINGTEGYAEEADDLAIQYEALSFTDVHRDTLHLIPIKSSLILDIGAGTGRDAAHLARQGHQVVAVEPTAELRCHSQRLHSDTAITWVDDALPELQKLRRYSRRFDVVLLTAVFMHLDEVERRTALESIGPLLTDRGILILSLRHGVVPPGRRMFEVSSSEVVTMAKTQDLIAIHESHRDDMQHRPGIHWTQLAFRRQAFA
ncbi:MAG: class I SAM-dependent methyltransferase [Alphaproteobacteria bacterium]